jgi:hypothetical protein
MTEPLQAEALIGAVEATIVTLEEFAEVEEEGAAALLGEPGSILIPENADIMFYGDGGAGKTTLSVDLAFHLGSGTDWLGIPVPRPVPVLMIENEGPRALMREKLRRKLAAWDGPQLEGRVRVFEAPWGGFSFADVAWRETLAAVIAENEIDVLVVGPVTRSGMDEAGTLQQVRDFMALVADVRARSGRRLTVILIHHENKSGAVSGAWEGAGDTLLHVQPAGNGHTVMFVQKARWDSRRHSTTLKLAWTEGEGFDLEGDRNYFVEIVKMLIEAVEWRTAKDIAAPKDKGGIGANEDTVREILDENPSRFESRTGKAAQEVGRSTRATVWQLRQGSDAVDSVGAFSGGAEGAAAPAPSLKGAAVDELTPGSSAVTESAGQLTRTQSAGG